MVFSKKKLSSIVLAAILTNCSPAAQTSNKIDDNPSSEFSSLATSFKSSAISPSAIIIPDDSSCTFNGQTVMQGDSVDAFQNSTVQFGNQCISEKRICTNATLSGSFQFASCSVDQPASCLFNGQTIPHGQSTAAYQNSSVAFGETCLSESRICNNGVLSGSNQFSSCQVGAPASCIFNGKTIENGQSLRAYIASSVKFGSSCQFEDRTCTNGVLSGSYQFESCEIGAAASCTFNGTIIAHGQNTTAFQNSSVSFSNTCVSENRSCDNGVLTGSYQFSTCDIGTPTSCQFNGQTVAHGQIITAFESSSVPFGTSCSSEQRTCDNGNLSGSNKFASCEVGVAASCLFNGQTIAHGQTINAYSVSTVEYGNTCTSEKRTCNNGTLSGTSEYATCQVNSPASCMLNGQTIAHGQIINAFSTATVSYGSICQSEQRVCENGLLSGSHQYSTCTIEKPASCNFNNTIIEHGKSVLAYLSTTVNSGSTCKSEQRYCDNGVLSGSYGQSTCTILPPNNPPDENPKNCKINNVIVNHGQFIKLFKAARVSHNAKCETEIRKCNDGNLSGSAIYQTCQADPKPPVVTPPKKPCDKKNKHDHKDKKPCDKKDR